MKIVATSDTHFPIVFDDRRLVPDGDVLIVAGDIMYNGNPQEWYPRIDSLAHLPHPHKYLVAGNHDLHIELYAGPAKAELRQRGIKLLGYPNHKRLRDTLPNGMSIGGCPFVTNLPGWAFNETEDNIAGYLEVLGRVDILVTHSPPAGKLDGRHYGVGAFNRYLNKYQPEIMICGHVHESYGSMKVGRTHLYNVCMCNGSYNQTNPAVVIEVDDSV